ncbi:hypothetical protein ACOZE3_30900 [Streptomyces cinereoruber]|uniref:hypothetical protein n=1 Tax=Streptomyces cinereoruber TaxID=67260 RepID=UPI003BF58566
MNRSRLVAAAALLVLATSAPTALALPADPGTSSAGLTAAGALDGTTARPGVRFHGVGSFAGPAARSEAFDISDRGVVVGAAAVPGSGATHAFVMDPETDGGRLTDITPSDPRSTRAEAVNRSGAVAGTLGIVPGAGLPQPFVWRPRTGLEVLPLPPGAAGAQAVDINDAGTVLVVGTDSTGVGLPVGSFLWDPVARAYRTLPTTGTAGDGAVPIARTLDERGGVAGGLVSPAGTGAWHHTATVWQPDTLTPRTLTSGGGSDTFATDRNEHGTVVGWRMDTPGTAPKAVYWPSADAAPVALPGQVAFEINDGGRIVGIRPVPGAAGFPFAAVMWEPGDGGRVRTADLGDQGLGSYANAVNSSGKTAGYVVTPGASSSYEAGGWWNPPQRG